MLFVCGNSWSSGRVEDSRPSGTAFKPLLRRPIVMNLVHKICLGVILLDPPPPPRMRFFFLTANVLRRKLDPL